MYVHVKVQAGAKSEKVEQVKPDHFKIAVREPAERNLANGRVGELVADFFQVSSGQVRLINGHHSPSKIFDVAV